MNKGFFVTTAGRWLAQNQAEDPYTNGVPSIDSVPRLSTGDFLPEDMDTEMLDGTDDRAEYELGDLSGREVVHPPTEDLLRSGKRQEVAARLVRREAERDLGDLVMSIVGCSTLAREHHVADLEDQINGMPEDLSRKRAAMRRQAHALAPHNLTEVIGEPNARGRS